MRSSVTVGKGAEAEMVAVDAEKGKMRPAPTDDRALLIRLSTFRFELVDEVAPLVSCAACVEALLVEPDKSIEAAADVVDAITDAAGDNG